MSSVKIQKIAIIAIICSLLSYLSHLLSLRVEEKYWLDFLRIAIILTILGFSLGLIAAVRKIKIRNEKIFTKTVAILAIILSIYTLRDIFIKNMFYIPKETVCGAHLSSLGKSLMVYANENKDRYPTADKWCDLLIEHADAPPKMFNCPNDKKGPSSFALNPNAEPNSPGDVVLLFESQSGWNQYGGKELLSPDNHKGNGANILFNDGHAEFIYKEDFGKLNWGISQEPNKIQNIKQ